MKMSFSVKIEKNDKLWRKMYKNLTRATSNSVVEVGWWGNTHPTAVPVAQVARWNDEGHITGRGAYSPARPFFKIGFMGKVRGGALQKYVRRVNDIAMGKLTWPVLNKMIAEDMKQAVQLEILNWSMPPNSPYTVAKKGHGDVLIDTGTMYDKVKSRVVRRVV